MGIGKSKIKEHCTHEKEKKKNRLNWMSKQQPILSIMRKWKTTTHTHEYANTSSFCCTVLLIIVTDKNVWLEENKNDETRKTIGKKRKKKVFFFN